MDSVSPNCYLTSRVRTEVLFLYHMCIQQTLFLPNKIRTRLSIEMGSDFGWYRYVGLDGKTMSVNSFGTSAPANVIIERYGFTVENVIKNIKELLNRN